MKRFATISEGITDFRVLKNLLIGYYNDKDLSVSQLKPEGKEPFGWGNLLAYLSSQKFKDALAFDNYLVIQIDTDKCEDWGAKLKNIGDDEHQINNFITDIKNYLIQKIGEVVYLENKERIIFAICVHEIECWILPFQAIIPAHTKKMVNCLKTLEFYANKKGFSTHQKDFSGSKNYDELSKEMKNHKLLLQNKDLNPSLKIFIDNMATYQI